MKHVQLRCYCIATCVLFSGFISASEALKTTQQIYADGSLNKQGLSANEINRIQFIGQALLASKRSATPLPDLTEQRLQVEALRLAAQKLTKPVPVVKLTVHKASNDSSVNRSFKKMDWHQTRSADIEQLRQAASKLRKASSSFGTGSLDSLLRNPFNRPVGDDFKGMTTLAQHRINQVEADVEQILALPEAERQQRLVALTKEFQLQSLPDLNSAISAPVETPTLITITQHRRMHAN